MNRTIPLLLLIITTSLTHAEFQARDLDGNTSTIEAYYDTALNISWLADANINGANTWSAQNTWASSLTSGGYTNWRLASMDVNGDNSITNCFNDIPPPQSVCVDNEYGHLYFYGGGTTLGNGVTPENPGPFSNIQSGRYWSGTGYVPYVTYAWDFVFNSGAQGISVKSFNKKANRYAWAVHPGDVGTPVAPIQTAE